MRILYDIVFILFALGYLPYMLLKGKYHKDFIQKLGFLPYDLHKLDRPVWIHAVSVGEAAVAAKLAKALKEKMPEVPIIISTTTQTGNDMAAKAAGLAADAVFYYPVDISFVVSRVLEIINPRMYVLVETELWPNFLRALAKRNVPAVLVNGRISDPSFRNYQKIGLVTRKILKGISSFCMQSARDGERIKALGAADDKVHITGNIKFDDPDKKGPDKERISRDLLGFSGQDYVLIAGSTHYPEEHQVIDIYRSLKEEIEGLKLVIAPRHVERAEAIGIYIKQSGMGFSNFSDIMNSGEKPAASEIIMVDTIGHLNAIYDIADVVFMGGSLVKKGGQNLIEPARCGKAVIFGPHMYNFREVAEIFTEQNAVCSIQDEKGLKEAIKDLILDPEKRSAMANRAREIVKKNSGAVSLTLDEIEKYVS